MRGRTGTVIIASQSVKGIYNSDEPVGVRRRVEERHGHSCQRESKRNYTVPRFARKSVKLIYDFDEDHQRVIVFSI
jgi:hypothetical protein